MLKNNVIEKTGAGGIMRKRATISMRAHGQMLGDNF
jgi:hypothetical protein